MTYSTTVVHECSQALLFFFCKGIFITLEHLVQTVIGRDKCLLILGNGIGDRSLSDTLRINGLEFSHQRGILTETLTDLFPCLIAHLNGIDWRTSSLIGKGVGTSIPELLHIEGSI